MHDLIIGFALLTMTVLAVLFAAAALISKAWLDGSLQADIKWARQYVRLHMQNRRHN
jgi:hypothetical protein